MNFIVVDAGLSEIRSNVCALEFQPEEFGYLGGAMTAAAAEGDIGYVSTFLNRFDNRILYGFLQGAENKKVHVRYMEEQTNVLKAADYMAKLAAAASAALIRHTAPASPSVTAVSILRKRRRNPRMRHC